MSNTRIKRVMTVCAAMFMAAGLIAGTAGCAQKEAKKPAETVQDEKAPEAEEEEPIEASEEKADGGKETGEKEVTLTFFDALDREVTVPMKPQRVACLIGSFADVWKLAGGADTIAAAANDAWTDFDIPLGEDVVNLGSSKKVTLEPIIASNPDLIIASSNTKADLELLDALEEMEIPTIYFEVSTFEDYLNMLATCSFINENGESYELYGTAVEEQVNAAREKAAAAVEKRGSNPTALYIRVSSNGCAVKNSEDNVLGEMLKDLQAVNVADSEESLLENLSIEKIMEIDPEYIFVVLQASDPAEAEAVLEETLLSNPAWASLTAVKEGNYHIMPNNMYNLKPNDKWGLAYEELEAILYPNE